MKTIIIAGGSGFLGQILVDYFRNRTETIYILTRSPKKNAENVKYMVWDAKTKGDWTNIFEGADVLINLTGKSVDCRYNEKNKKLILDSRINSTKILGQVISACENPPKIWLNSSTATIYRHSLDKEMDEENGEIGSGFSVNVATAWEDAFFGFSLPRTRRVALRTSIVLGHNGGAFLPIKKMTQIGFGGNQGTGTQKVSWIHATDFARSIAFIIKNERIKGTINIVSPKPTTNTELMRNVREKINIPFGIPMNKFFLELGARIIKTETELILKSRNVVPKKLQDAGFKFTFGTLDKALNNLLK